MDWTDLTVNDVVLCEIGRITIFQTHIERNMASFIRCLLDIDEDSANLLTYRLRFWQLLKDLESLLWNSGRATREEIERFGEFKKKMKRIVPDRNSYVHSMWSFSDEPNSATKITYLENNHTKKILRNVQTVSLDQLKKINAELKHLTWLIGDIRIKTCGK